MDMDSDINSNFTEDDLAFTVKLLTQEPVSFLSLIRQFRSYIQLIPVLRFLQEILSLTGDNEKVLRNIRAKVRQKRASRSNLEHFA